MQNLWVISKYTWNFTVILWTYPINATQMQHFSPLLHINCHKNGEMTLPQVSYRSCTLLQRTGFVFERIMHNKPQKCEILEDRQRTSGHSLQATWRTQHSEFHTYTEVCVCPEESLVTFKCSIGKILFNSISSTQSNLLWGPCRLYSDKFPAKFSYKILLNSTSILWWPPEGPGHSSKMGLCHPIHPDRCSLCLWATGILSDCRQLQSPARKPETATYCPSTFVNKMKNFSKECS